MLSGDSENTLEPICNRLNIREFTLYSKGELSRDQERQIEAHCARCDDCKANLAYVWEIIKGKEQLSIDEQTLLLKYLHDPIYKDFLEKLRTNIRQEILAEVKLILKDQKAANNNSTSNNNNGSKTKSLNKKRSIYSYLVLASSFTVLLILSFCTYLIIDKIFPSHLDFTSLKSTQTIPKQNQEISNNLYQQLNTAINEYLSSKDNSYLVLAQEIANKIKNTYKDNYGVDLVNYYKVVPDSAKEKLLGCRIKLEYLSKQPNGDDYQLRLEQAQQIQIDFNSLGNVIESYKTKVLIAELSMRLLQYSEAMTITNNGLDFANKHHYIFLQGYFLLWQAKLLTESTDFAKTEALLKQTINIGESLNIDELILSPSMSLAAIYLQNDDNPKALQIAQNALSKHKQFKLENTISLLQVAGLSAFNSKFSDLSASYLNEAIKLSKEANSPAMLARSYTFLAVTLAESNKFEQAEEFYTNAITETSKINEEISRKDLLSIVLGYQAKTKLLMGEYSNAITLYKETLNILKEIGANNALENAQLEEGLAQALQKTGKETEATQHIDVAKNYRNLAESKKEKANCLLSFLPSNCL